MGLASGLLREVGVGWEGSGARDRHLTPPEHNCNPAEADKTKEDITMIIAQLIAMCNWQQQELQRLAWVIDSNRDQQDDTNCVATISNLGTFAEPATISQQLTTLKADVRLLQQQPASSSHPLPLKMPNFRIEKFDDYTKTDPLAWWQGFTTELGLREVPERLKIAALYLNSTGAARVWLNLLAVKEGVNVENLDSKLNWDAITAQWKAHFIVQDTKARGINQRFKMHTLAKLKFHCCPVLSLAHACHQICNDQHQQIQGSVASDIRDSLTSEVRRTAYLVFSGATDGTIAVWDVTKEVRWFADNFQDLVLLKGTLVAPRPVSGRGSGGGGGRRRVMRLDSVGESTAAGSNVGKRHRKNKGKLRDGNGFSESTPILTEGRMEFHSTKAEQISIGGREKACEEGPTMSAGFAETSAEKPAEIPNSERPNVDPRCLCCSDSKECIEELLRSSIEEQSKDNEEDGEAEIRMQRVQLVKKVPAVVLPVSVISRAHQSGVNCLSLGCCNRSDGRKQERRTHCTFGYGSLDSKAVHRMLENRSALAQLAVEGAVKQSCKALEQDADDRVYMLVTGGDDQAIHVACFRCEFTSYAEQGNVSWWESDGYDERAGTSSTVAHKNRSSDEELSYKDGQQEGRSSGKITCASSTIIKSKKITQEEEELTSGSSEGLFVKVVFLGQDMLTEAHSSALKGIWTDGQWIFSAGLDQRLRCWEIDASIPWHAPKLCETTKSDNESRTSKTEDTSKQGLSMCGQEAPVSGPGRETAEKMPVVRWRKEVKDRDRLTRAQEAAKHVGWLKEQAWCICDVPEVAGIDVNKNPVRDFSGAGTVFEIAVVGRGLQVIHCMT
ncbi:hypothetical protein CBR_g26440 [Chara braunii]|uniref:Ig-like domain-containing protein n=1 Tax=Chara braunii TaxID=69332 RepID=A0A388L847_CHABU|nr:hypothetical protein CBR_g26440 [Chara braunii]|eukprot:GBG78412.1 hypothetical protein CBR_g26440 [Chara braunii]